jgi:hypothetical protein
MAPGRLNILATFNRATDPQAMHLPQVGVIISQSRQRLASCKGTTLELDEFICVLQTFVGEVAVGETGKLTVELLSSLMAPVKKGIDAGREIQKAYPKVTMW